MANQDHGEKRTGKQVAPGGLLAKYGAKLDQAVKAAAGEDTVTIGYRRLPGGITNGVAQLQEVGFGQVDPQDASKTYKGEYYFRAMGTVVSPTHHTGPHGVEEIAGLQTSIMEMVCDTVDSNGKPTSQEQHVQRILIYLRMLGQPTQGAGGRDLERLALALQKAAQATPLYFKFSTSVGKKRKPDEEPRVFENWHGTQGLENFVPPDTEAHQDDTPEEEITELPEEADEAVTEEPTPAPAARKPVTPKPMVKGPPTAGAKPQAKRPAPEPEQQEFNEFQDLKSDLENAHEDEDAQRRLKKAALDAGHSEEDVDNAATWEVVYEMALNPVTPVEEPEAEEEFIPKNNLVVGYTPPKAKKEVECKVTAVDAQAKTVSLKNLDDGKSTYTKVKWSSLTPLS